jgi:threonine dehydratase
MAGERYADALAESERYVARSGAMPIHAFDQPETLLGQGTVGMEFEEQAPTLDTLLVGVEPEAAPTLYRALEAGRPVDAEAGGIAADALAPRRVGEIMFPLAQRHVDRVALVPDAAIAQAQATLWRALRLVAEPGGAAALAALLSGAYRPQPGERIGVLLCGGNPAGFDFLS